MKYQAGAIYQETLLIVRYMLTCTILSFILLAGFIALSTFLNRELPGSYSAFSALWADEIPMSNLNVWSIVTAVVAFEMVPPMIEAGVDNPVQFLGFFAPLYLIVVSLTPEWDIDKNQHRVHVAGAVTCAVLALLWLVLIREHWWVVCACFVAAVIAGSWTKTLPGCRVFWGECVMFLSVYLSLIIG